MLLRATGERRFILTKEIAMTIKTDRLILREMTTDGLKKIKNGTGYSVSDCGLCA